MIWMQGLKTTKIKVLTIMKDYNLAKIVDCLQLRRVEIRIHGLK